MKIRAVILTMTVLLAAVVSCAPPFTQLPADNGNSSSSSGASPVTNGYMPVYVSASGNDGNSGLLPSLPVFSLQLAVNTAKSNNSTALYVSGDFLLTNTNLNNYKSGISFEGLSNLLVSGGWNPGFTAQNGASLWNGGQKATHVVFMKNCAGMILSNLAITGNYDGSSQSGGGFYTTNCVQNTFVCIVTNNHAGIHGGGYFLTNSCNNLIDGTVCRNQAEFCGGGLDLYDCLSNTVIAEIFSNEVLNVSDAYGGGMDLYQSHYTAVLSFIHHNRSCSYGGGVSIMYSTNCTFSSSISSNESVMDGGGFYLLNTVNATFNSNSAILYNHCDINDSTLFIGGGIYYYFSVSNLFLTSLTNPNFIGSGTLITNNIYGL